MIHRTDVAECEIGHPRAEIAARFLALLFDALASSSSPIDLAPRVAAAAAAAVDGWSALWLTERSTGSLHLAAVHHQEPSKSLLAEQLVDGWLPLEHQALPSTVAGQSRISRLVAPTDLQAEELFGSPRRAQLATQVGCSCLLVAPLVRGHRTLGLLLLAPSAADVEADEEWEELAIEMGRHVTTAIVQIQRLDSARQASQQLTLTSLHLQAILDSIPQGIVVASAPEGRMVSTSRALVRLLGRQPDLQAAVRHYPQLYGLIRPTGEHYRTEELPWVRSVQTGEPTPVQEMIVRHPNGLSLTALCSASPILDESGHTVGSVALLQDISDRKELEIQKDEFLAMVAHELKTPLTAVKGYVQLLMRFARQQPDARLGEREVGMLQVADRQVSRLSQLVFDLLDFSVIRMGRLELRRFKFNLGSLAGDVVAQMQLTAPDRELRVLASADSLVEADPHRVEQLLMNLISNAIKATAPNGKIEVSVRRRGNSVVTAVTDNGVGMSEGVRRRIFDRYYRGPDHRYEGIGLGLFVSKGIVDAHGGEIWVESEAGKGSSFHFSLPAASD
ncbi:MAG: sensor histidine kinase [Chloroflexota bacterium]